MGKIRYLSFTASERYTKCGYLQKCYANKQVGQPSNVRDYFAGRVVHTAFEGYMLAGGVGISLPERFRVQWSIQEREDAHNLAWGSKAFPSATQDREEAYRRGLAVAVQLQADVEELRLTSFRCLIEPKFRAEIIPGSVGMYAQPDFLAFHPTEPLVYLGEMKSGSSFKKAQLEWYAAVLKRQPDLTIERIFALSLRPALDQLRKPDEGPKPRVETWEITEADRFKQENRATDVCEAMADEMWPAKLGGYCSNCEARAICPSYQASAAVGTGMVGLPGARPVA